MLVSRPAVNLDPPRIEVPSGWMSQGGVLVTDLRAGDGPYAAMADRWMVSQRIRDMIVGAREAQRARGYFATEDDDALGC